MLQLQSRRLQTKQILGLKDSQMANRNFNRYQALTKEVKALFAQVAIGASGAPTLSAAKSLGVASIDRNSAGNYTITLSDKYMDLLQLGISRELASGTPDALGGFVIRSQDVDAAKTIVVEFVDAAGAAIDPANGTTLRLKIDLKNSSVQR